MSSRCSSSIWVTQLLLLAPSTEWQRERNKQMVWWKVGRLLSETVLANASLQCAHNCGLHRGVVVFLRVFLPGLFVASPWQFEVFLDLGVYPKTGKFLCFGSISYLSVLGEKLFWGWANMLDPATDTPSCSQGLPVPQVSLVSSVPEVAGPVWRFHPQVLCVCEHLLEVFSQSWGLGTGSICSFWFMSWGRASHGALSAFSCDYNGQPTQTLHGDSKNGLKWLKHLNIFFF